MTFVDSRSARKSCWIRIIRVDSCLFVVQAFPKRGQLARPEVRQDFAIHVNHRRGCLAGEPIHLFVSFLVGDDIQNFILDAVLIEPIHRLRAPAAEWFDEQADFLGLIHLAACLLCVVRSPLSLTLQQLTTNN